MNLRPSAARAASARADALLATCEGLRTPVISTRIIRPTLLIPRELEIAWLAAGGASDAQIAAQLFTSTRTVEGHLVRADGKLGISCRQDLRDLLDADAPEDA